jgi:YHS domain-containing protein
VKKLILLTGVALIVAPGALAAPDKDKKAATPETIACPVMPANKVNVKAATAKKMFADYKGNRYFFCCAGCPEAFKKDSAKYAKAAHIATPKAGKGKKA